MILEMYLYVKSTDTFYVWKILKIIKPLVLEKFW